MSTSINGTPLPSHSLTQRVFIKNRDLVYISCNELYAQDLGITPAEIAGKTDYDFHPTELADQYRADDKAVLNSGEDKDVEEPYMLEGRQHWIHTIKLPIRDEQGRVTSVLGMFWDITEQKQADTEREQLLARLNLLSTIVENTTDLVAAADMESHIIYVNPAGMAMMGRTGQDYTQMTIADVHPPELYASLRKNHLDIVKEKGFHVWEGAVQNINGSPIPVSQLTTILRDSTGKLIGYGTVMRDIRQQKEIEAAQARLQEEIILAQQNALKELTTPIIPLMEQIIVMPLIGSIDSLRAKDLTRALLQGIGQYRAKVVILDITGVPIVDSGVASHLNKTIQTARLKGARIIITGVSDAVAEAVVDLGIDWSNLETVRDLQTGLTQALNSLGIRLVK